MAMQKTIARQRVRIEENFLGARDVPNSLSYISPAWSFQHMCW